MSKVETSASIGGWRAVETERIALSQRNRDRLRVLHEVKERHLTQIEAAERLKVPDRQVRRLLSRKLLV